MAKPAPISNRYKALIERIFRDHYRKGLSRVEFERDEIIAMAREMNIEVPKNLGDVIYSLRVGFESHEARAMRRTRSMTEAA